ncbi:MAG: ATP-binding protein [Deltaproteobacteria bacterium]|nr:ATP-binding protein [Deltaproteobacteria bacterium]
METKGTVLIISGNPDLKAACRQALVPGDFSIRSAHSLQEWAPTTRELDVDIVLLDAATLPESPPPNLLSSLWEKNADLVFLILSEQSTLDKALQAIQADAYDVILVPLVPELLLLRVTRAMEKRRMSLELKRLRTFEMFVSRLWSVAKGEMDGFYQFTKEFTGVMAFRLTMAHEFRAPLAALQSFLLLLIKGYVPPDQQQQILQHAIDRAQDLLVLVDDLMDLATVREEHSAAKRSRVRLADELGKVIPTLKAEAQEKGLILTVKKHQNPEVVVNSIQMRQLWTNLISNAIKYTRAGGRIRVLVDQEDEWAIGCVEDTGIGIAPKDQALIFNQFYRAPEAKEMERRGTGLGLPIVKRIVEGYGGQIEVESTPGKGTSFRFTLPLGNATGDPEATQE